MPDSYVGLTRDIQLRSINSDISMEPNCMGILEHMATELNVRENDKFWHSIYNLTFFIPRQIYFHRWLIHWLMSNCDTELTSRDTKGVIT